eukprot:gene6759-10924_t
MEAQGSKSFKKVSLFGTKLTLTAEKTQLINKEDSNFAFYYWTLVGDGSITFKLESNQESGCNFYTKSEETLTGLMIFNSTPHEKRTNTAQVGFKIQRGNVYLFNKLSKNEQNIIQTPKTVKCNSGFYKLEIIGSSFTAYFSKDEVSWSKIGESMVNTAIRTTNLGMILKSGEETEQTVQFSNIKFYNFKKTTGCSYNQYYSVESENPGCKYINFEVVPKLEFDVLQLLSYCFGKNSSDPEVCSKNGGCVGTDTCNCNTGYVGNECQFPTPFPNPYTLPMGEINAQYYEWDPITTTFKMTITSGNDIYFIFPVCIAQGCRLYRLILNGWSNKRAEFYQTQFGAGLVIPNPSPLVALENLKPLTGNDKVWMSFNKNNFTIGYGDVVGNDTLLNYPLTNFQKPNYVGVVGFISTVVFNDAYFEETLLFCNGKNASDPLVCSSRGICNNTETCFCFVGFSGINCELTTCYGVISSNSSTCSGNGTCISPDNCICNSRRTGFNCQYVSLNDGIFNVTKNNTDIQYHEWSGSSKRYALKFTVVTGNDLYFTFPTCLEKGCSFYRFILNGWSNSQSKLTNGTFLQDRNIDNLSLTTKLWINTNPLTSNTTFWLAFLRGSFKVGYGETVGDQIFFNAPMGELFFPNFIGLSQNGAVADVFVKDVYFEEMTPICNGTNHTDPMVCLSRGYCDYYDTCICQTGYSGNLCQLSNCFGKNATDSNICSGKGTCVDIDKCSCVTGNVGLDCSVPTCFGNNATSYGVCSNNGNCTAVDTCNCNNSFLGNNCQYASYFPNPYTLVLRQNNAEYFDWELGSEKTAFKFTVAQGNDIYIMFPNCMTKSCLLYRVVVNGWSDSSTRMVLGNYSDNNQAINRIDLLQSVSVPSLTVGTKLWMYFAKPRFWIGYGEVIGKDVMFNVSLPHFFYPQKVGLSHYEFTFPKAIIKDVHFEKLIPICNEKNNTDPTVCSSRGVCDFTDTCICESGFTGNDCELNVCGGKNQSDSTVCSGRGICSSPNNCTCESEYFGENCYGSFCFGINSTNSSVCSGNGTCVALDNCSCNHGYTGYLCDFLNCNGKNVSDPEVCSGNGTCVSVDNCTCNNGYLGNNCESHTCSGVIYNNTTVCSGNGMCIGYNKCLCKSGYTGLNCDLPICFGNHSTDACSGNGICKSPDNCVCNSNFSGQTCELFYCFGISSKNSAACSAHGKCISPNNCFCAESYSGNQCEFTSCYGKNSSDINTCMNGTCISENNCSCSEGYFGDQCQLWQCKGIYSNDSTVCSGHGICSSPESCVCERGFFGSICESRVPLICYGKQENDATVCSGKGKCVGADVCQCDEFYAGTECQGYYCFDKLNTNPGVCSFFGTCTSPNQCTCIPGYVGDECDKTTCFGKSSSDPTVCSSNGACVGPNKCICREKNVDAQCNKLNTTVTVPPTPVPSCVVIKNEFLKYYKDENTFILEPFICDIDSGWAGISFHLKDGISTAKFMVVAFYDSKQLRIVELDDHKDFKTKEYSTLGLLLPKDDEIEDSKFENKRRFIIKVYDNSIEKFDHITVACSKNRPTMNFTSFPRHSIISTKEFSISKGKSNCDDYIIQEFSKNLSDTSAVYWLIELSIYIIILFLLMAFSRNEPLKSRVKPFTSIVLIVVFWILVTCQDLIILLVFPPYVANCSTAKSFTIYILHFGINITIIVFLLSIGFIDILFAINHSITQAKREKYRRFFIWKTIKEQFTNFYITNDPFLFRSEQLLGIVFFVFFIIIEILNFTFLIPTKNEFTFYFWDNALLFGKSLRLYLLLFSQAILPLFITIVNLVIRRIRSKNKRKVNLDLLDAKLENRELFDLFLEFAKLEWSQENAFAYRDIKKYQRTKSKEKREKLAFDIYYQYFNGDLSPLEVNIDKNSCNQLWNEINSPKCDFSDDVFENAMKTVKVNISDTWSRFIISTTYHVYLSNENLFEKELLEMK